MSAMRFTPTEEQARIIAHEGSAFVAACPGSGKTRVLVERARKLLADHSSGQGVVFLSFTTAAVSELEKRLRREGLLGVPAFPHFIGTFDAFLWQFLIAPFGVPGCTERPRLIPDKDQCVIRPYPKAQELPLGCFDRARGCAIPEALKKCGFTRDAKAYETAARSARARFLERGELDFADARELALARLRDPVSSPVLSRALAARFQELIVDEAQDCNPTDLEIINWFRSARIPVKIICDPHQSIYEFRGGVTDELLAYGQSYSPNERLPITGNFRSSRHIAKTIVALRAPSERSFVDDALGEHRDEPTPVYLLSYPGRGVPSSIGLKFHELTETVGLDASTCPVIAATRLSCANALGHPIANDAREDMSYRLAAAVSSYHFSLELDGRKEALEAVHKIVLELEGNITGKTYHQYLREAEIEPGAWRPRILQLVDALRFDSARFSSVDAWHDHARSLLAPLIPPGGRSINQRLQRNPDLAKALAIAPTCGHCACTIHSVKGMEFPAVCVVMSPQTAKRILDFLSGDSPSAHAEDARKIYVGASRAQRLLAIAVPQSQTSRLMNLLQTTGAAISVVALSPQ